MSCSKALQTFYDRNKNLNFVWNLSIFIRPCQHISSFLFSFFPSFLLFFHQFFPTLNFILPQRSLFSKFPSIIFFSLHQNFFGVFIWRSWGSLPHRFVVANMQDWDIFVSEFKLQSRYYIHLRINTLGESINPLISQLLLCCKDSFSIE